MTSSIREQYEKLEHQLLSPNAVKADESRGRLIEEAPDPVRTCFQRDRDRIIHSKSFRRLKHKTQVFIDPEEDHYRTRLTHTLEVAQIARTIARALRLNEDLVEAIALGHDLGHTPFGHAGEEALDEVMREFVPNSGFRHSEQSLRVVDVLEKRGLGLNLTWEVRDGILHHSKGQADLSIDSTGPATLEGKIVKISDRVAYINHDIDDAIRAGIITNDDLPKEAIDVLGSTHSARIGSMVVDIIENSRESAVGSQQSMGGRDSRRALVVNQIGMSDRFRIATDCLKDYMFAGVYGRDVSGIANLKIAGESLKRLFRYYMEHISEIPEMMDGDQKNCVCTEARARKVCDFLSGMTDRYAQKEIDRKLS